MMRRLVSFAVALPVVLVLAGTAQSQPPKGCKADCEKKVAAECGQPCIKAHAACTGACGCDDPKTCTPAQEKCIGSCTIRWTACINRCDQAIRQCTAKCP
jgi:hypothetical protein